METENKLAVLPSQPISVIPIEEMDKMATFVAQSGMLGTTNKSAVQTLMLLCQSEGLHPIKVLQSYDIIENKPSMKASAMVGKFIARGHYILIHIRDKDECSATFFSGKPDDKAIERAKKRYKLMIAEEKDNSAISDLSYPGEVTIIRTMIAALQSGLAKSGNGSVKVNWEKSGTQMLYARCMSEGVNVIDPGIKAGMSTPEEVEDILESEKARLLESAARRPTDEEDLNRRNAEIDKYEQQREIDREKNDQAATERLKKSGLQFVSVGSAATTPESSETKPEPGPVDKVGDHTNVVDGEFSLEAGAEVESIPDFHTYKLQFVNSSYYKGKELQIFNSEEIKKLREKKGVPFLNSKDAGLKLEAQMIEAAFNALP